MKYPKEYLEEIKLRLKVSQVVGKYVKLKKRGKEFIGLSPFSNEKTPSFTVNDEKGFIPSRWNFFLLKKSSECSKLIFLQSCLCEKK